MIPYSDKTKNRFLKKPYTHFILVYLLLIFTLIACVRVVDEGLTSDSIAHSQLVADTTEDTEQGESVQIFTTQTPTAQITPAIPPSPTSTSVVVPTILPAPLYFATDTTIARLETDGVTISSLVTEAEQPISYWQLSSAGSILYYQTGEKIVRFDTINLIATDIVMDARPAHLNRGIGRRHNNSFALSPNNETLAYISRDNNLMISDSWGQNKTMLVDGEAPPTDFIERIENHIFYPSYTRWELEQQIYDPLWSPTGDKIAFGLGGLQVMPTIGGPYHTLGNNTLGYEFKNDAQFSSYLGSIFKARSWSPDGTTLLFEEETLTADVSDSRFLLANLNNGSQFVLPLENADIVSSQFFDLWRQDSTQLYMWSFGNFVAGNIAFYHYNTQEGANTLKQLADNTTTPYTAIDALYEIETGEIYLFADSRSELIWPLAPRFYTLYQTTPQFFTTGDIADLIALRPDVFTFEESPQNYMWASDGSGIIIHQLSHGEMDPDTRFWPITDEVWVWVPLDSTQDPTHLPLSGQSLQLAWGQ